MRVAVDIIICALLASHAWLPVPLPAPFSKSSLDLSILLSTLTPFHLSFSSISYSFTALFSIPRAKAFHKSVNYSCPVLFHATYVPFVALVWPALLSLPHACESPRCHLPWSVISTNSKFSNFHSWLWPSCSPWLLSYCLCSASCSYSSVLLDHHRHILLVLRLLARTLPATHPDLFQTHFLAPAFTIFCRKLPTTSTSLLPSSSKIYALSLLILYRTSTCLHTFSSSSSCLTSFSKCCFHSLTT